MFKARHSILGRDVISLDPTLSAEQLRTWVRQNQLVCPGCGTEVDYRRQGVRRAHFAHRTNLGCHYNAGDPEVVAARAALYAFLVDKALARGGKVDLEVQLPGAPDGDLVDVWLELPGNKPVAYRILKSGHRPFRLHGLEVADQRAGAVSRYLLTLSRRSFEQPKKEDPSSGDHRRLSIPAPDRHLFFWRDWDRYHIKTLAEPRRYASLAYIDPHAERLILYRNLWRPADCNPSTYDYEQVHEVALSELRVHKGDLIFPDEKDAKDVWEEWATSERERLQKEEALRKQVRPRSPWAMRMPRSSVPRTASTVKTVPPVRALTEEIRCVSCGQLTRDWWTRHRPGEGECRACLYRRQGKEPKFCASCGSAFPPTAQLIDGLCPDCRRSGGS